MAVVWSDHLVKRRCRCTHCSDTEDMCPWTRSRSVSNIILLQCLVITSVIAFLITWWPYMCQIFICCVSAFTTPSWRQSKTLSNPDLICKRLSMDFRMWCFQRVFPFIAEGENLNFPALWLFGFWLAISCDFLFFLRLHLSNIERYTLETRTVFLIYVILAFNKMRHLTWLQISIASGRNYKNRSGKVG